MLPALLFLASLAGSVYSHPMIKSRIIGGEVGGAGPEKSGMSRRIGFP
jgi:hypothetical protein